LSRKPNDVKKNLIDPTLTALINNLKRGSRVIQGSLHVAPGHDYWWFLEYGTGQFHEAPKDDDVVQPEATKGYVAKGEPYEINAKNGSKYLVYMTRRGGTRYIRRKKTEHDGIEPIGMIRTATFDAMLYLKQDLDRVASRKGKWKDMPKREDLVELVNEVLDILIGTLRLWTPDNSDPDPNHEGRNPIPLSEAWFIKKAK
jgi:hypothetical protein